MEGIDPEFLAALPPELQAEVMENQVCLTSIHLTVFTSKGNTVVVIHAAFWPMNAWLLLLLDNCPANLPRLPSAAARAAPA